MTPATLAANEPDNKSVAAKDPSDPVAADLSGDWPNLYLLILLYVMQGMPLGLAAAVPILLQSNENVSYKDQVRRQSIRRYQSYRGQLSTGGAAIGTDWSTFLDGL